MRRWIAGIVAVVGFISTTIALVQAFTFNHLPTITASYPQQSRDDGGILELVHDVHGNIGNVVMVHIDLEADTNFERRVQGNVVSRHFGTDTVALAVGRPPAYPGNMPTEQMRREEAETARLVDQRLSGGRVNYDSAFNYLADNGTTLRIDGGGQAVNPFSSFRVNSEGRDIADGPFIVGEANYDGNIQITLSPAPFTDELSAQVRCARRDWPALVKFFACPFA